jgi:hypothetical protein
VWIETLQLPWWGRSTKVAPCAGRVPKPGIKGNSHMLMQDKNNIQLADLILTWIDQHVESKKAAHHH